MIISGPRPAPFMEGVLFSRLWQELDFDDHPYPGSHSPEPQGELSTTYHGDAITLADERVSFRLGRGDDGETSIHRWTSEAMRINDGPKRLGEHRWSISPQDLGLQLSAFVAVKIGPPESASERDEGESDPHSSVSAERVLLGRIRDAISPHIPDWTWHLEVDNKPDRTGWYIRAPSEWASLFTIFAGLGWHPDKPEEKHGFLLFERAPPGELDRPDEEEANKLDALRTVALCNSQRGALTVMAGEPMWSHRAEPTHLTRLSGSVQLWPPSMGRWPLLVARQTDVGMPLEQPDVVASWMSDLVTELGPALSTLSTKIDGLSWK